MTLIDDRLSGAGGNDLVTPHMPATLYEGLVAFYANYTRAAAGGDIEGWPGFFTPDGLYWANSRENVERGWLLPAMLCDGQPMAVDRAATIVQTQVFQPRRTRYLVTAVRILGTTADGGILAEADFGMTQTMVGSAPELVMTGEYRDEIVRAPDGRLLFRRHTVIYDNDVIISSLVMPL